MKTMYAYNKHFGKPGRSAPDLRATGWDLYLSFSLHQWRIGFSLGGEIFSDSGYLALHIDVLCFSLTIDKGWGPF